MISNRLNYHLVATTFIIHTLTNFLFYSLSIKKNYFLVFFFFQTTKKERKKREMIVAKIKKKLLKKIIRRIRMLA